MTRFVVLIAILLSACSVTIAPGVGQADAVTLVLEQQPQFGGLEARDPALIGQAGWYEVSAADGGWQVVVRIGWGDCPAGCINEHLWTYQVTAAGDVTLTGETGDPWPGAARLSGQVTAGPTCPVVTDPPDPNCADRAVAGAVLVIEDGNGREVARVTSDTDGAFSVDLAPGDYRVVPQPVEGLMGTAEPVDVHLEIGVSPELQISYDTGIR